MSGKNTLKDIISRIKNHDQTFEYSDDFSVYLRGLVDKKLIIGMLCALDNDLAVKIIIKYIRTQDVRMAWLNDYSSGNY